MARRISLLVLGALLAACGSSASGGGSSPVPKPTPTADEAMHAYGQQMSKVVLLFSSTLNDYFECQATHDPNTCESAHAVGGVLGFAKLASITPPPQAQAAHAAAAAAMDQIAQLFPSPDPSTPLPSLDQVRALGKGYLDAMQGLTTVCPDCDGADAIQRWNAGIQRAGG